MKKLGRWFVVLLILELVLAFWMGNRIRNRFEAPIRIIGEVTPSTLPWADALREFSAPV